MHARLFSLLRLFLLSASFVLCAPMWGGDISLTAEESKSRQPSVARVPEGLTGQDPTSEVPIASSPQSQGQEWTRPSNKRKGPDGPIPVDYTTPGSGPSAGLPGPHPAPEMPIASSPEGRVTKWRWHEVGTLFPESFASRLSRPQGKGLKWHVVATPRGSRSPQAQTFYGHATTPELARHIPDANPIVADHQSSTSEGSILTTHADPGSAGHLRPVPGPPPMPELSLSGPRKTSGKKGEPLPVRKDPAEPVQGIKASTANPFPEQSFKVITVNPLPVQSFKVITAKPVPVTAQASWATHGGDGYGVFSTTSGPSDSSPAASSNDSDIDQYFGPDLLR